jgi:hypothetical protein
MGATAADDAHGNGQSQSFQHWKKRQALKILQAPEKCINSFRFN